MAALSRNLNIVVQPNRHLFSSYTRKFRDSLSDISAADSQVLNVLSPLCLSAQASLVCVFSLLVYASKSQNGCSTSYLTSPFQVGKCQVVSPTPFQKEQWINEPGTWLPQNKIQILLLRSLNENWAGGSASCNWKLILQWWLPARADVAFRQLILIYKESTIAYKYRSMRSMTLFA